MARPNKQGVDYFPLDVHLDDKFKFIEIKYKLEGFAILTKLMQKIYSYGYWYRWTEDEALLFADELRTDYEKVKGVVDEALERGVFDKDMYEKYNILTSSGIQKRYKEIVRRRKDVEVIEEYLLIDGTFGVNDDINPSPSKHDDSKSTQSKVKESKVKETKEQIPYADIVNRLNEKAGKKFKPSANKTKDLIKARWNEGNKLEDFYAVIDHCSEKWSGQVFTNGKKGDDYLQPSTLFNGKFDERLNWTLNKETNTSNRDTRTPDQIEHDKMMEEMGLEH